MTNDREYRRTHPWITFRHHLERADPLHWSLLGEAAARCDHVAQAVLPPAGARELHRLYLIKGARGHDGDRGEHAKRRTDRGPVGRASGAPAVPEIPEAGGRQRPEGSP